MQMILIVAGLALMAPLTLIALACLAVSGRAPAAVPVDPRPEGGPR